MTPEQFKNLPQAQREQLIATQLVNGERFLVKKPIKRGYTINSVMKEAIPKLKESLTYKRGDIEIIEKLSEVQPHIKNAVNSEEIENIYRIALRLAVNIKR